MILINRIFNIHSYKFSMYFLDTIPKKSTRIMRRKQHMTIISTFVALIDAWYNTCEECALNPGREDHFRVSTCLVFPLKHD